MLIAEVDILKNVEIRDQKIILDNTPKFLFSAEIHYFRLQPNTWEDRLKKIKDAGIDTISFYVPWFFHELQDGVFDFDGKTDLRRDLIGFIELTKKYGFNIIFKPGPYVMSELKNEGLPSWIYEKIPHAIAKTLDGENHPSKVFSYLHGDFLRYVKRWYENVLEIAKNGNLIFIQIDNEVGMLQWVTGHGDYNEDTINKFKFYLKDIGDNELLKELELWSYGKRFSKGLLVRYHEFSRFYYAEYLKKLEEFVRVQGINVPVIVNIHGFDMVEYAKRGKNYPIGVSQLMKSASFGNVILSGDYYIGNVVHENFSDLAIANAIMYAIQGKDQPLFSAEFQSGFQMDKPKLLPSTLDLTSRLCIGNGMNGINYYLFVGGYNPEGAGLMGEYHDWQAPISADGNLRKGYYVLKDLIREVNLIEKELVESKPVFDTFFGFIPTYYATEFFREHGIDVGDLVFKRDISIFDGVMRGLKLLNVNFGGVNLEDEKDIDPVLYPSLWVFSNKFMPSKVQEKLIRYIKNGGKLVVFPELPLKDEFGNVSTTLLEFLGISKVEKYGWRFAKVFDTEINSYHVDSYEFSSQAVEIFGKDLEGDICAFKKNIENGSVFVLGCGLEVEREYKIRVIERIIDTLNIRKTLNIISDDGFVDAYLRESEHKYILFLNNYDDYGKKVDVYINGNFYGKYSIDSRSGKILVFDK